MSDREAFSCFTSQGAALNRGRQPRTFVLAHKHLGGAANSDAVADEDLVRIQLPQAGLRVLRWVCCWIRQQRRLLCVPSANAIRAAGPQSLGKQRPDVRRSMDLSLLVLLRCIDTSTVWNDATLVKSSAGDRHSSRGCRKGAQHDHAQVLTWSGCS